LWSPGCFPLSSCRGTGNVPYTIEKIFTSILPESKREAENFLAALLSVARRESVVAVRNKEMTKTDTRKRNKLHRVRGGCLGAEGRRRTRRPAKRSRGAACKR
jgi:hypothetical protein